MQSPSPWKYELRHGSKTKNGWGARGLWDANGDMILGDAPGWGGGFQPPENEEDIALLEAAPDLLAACKALLRFDQNFGLISNELDTDDAYLDAALKLMQAAVAKADKEFRA